MHDLTRGSIGRHLLALSAFMAVSMVFQTLYFLADLFFVGHLGKEAIAAVSLSGNLMMVVLALTQVLSVGTTTLVSHAVGQKDRAHANLVFNQAFAVSIAGGVGFGAIGFLLRGAYCRALAADDATVALGVQYLTFFVPALALQFTVVALAAALRGSGVVKPTMVIQVLSVALNIVLAPILILGWGTGRPMGVAGAGLASLIAILAGIALFWRYFLGPEVYLRFVPSEWRPRSGVVSRLMGIGLPAGGEFGLMSAYLMLIYWITRPLGAAAQAGFGVGGRVMQSLFLPVMAVAFAAAPIAGQNYGARDGARVRATFRLAAVASCSLMLLLTLVSHIAPEALIAVFSSDPGVIAFGAQFLRIISWNYPAMALIFTSSSLFQGMGNTLPPLLSSSMRLLLFALPAVVLSRQPGFDIRSVWFLSVASVAVQAIVNLVLLRREFARRLAFVPAAPPPAEAVAAAG
jgi:putative MATE family efflux protein